MATPAWNPDRLSDVHFEAAVEVSDVLKSRGELTVVPDPEPKTKLVEKDSLLKEATDQLLALLQLPPGWDSFDAEKIKPQAVLGTLALLIRAVDTALPCPKLMPLPTGGINMVWHRGVVDLEVDVDGFGQGGFLYANDETGHEIDGDLPDNEGQLRELLRAMYSAD